MSKTFQEILEIIEDNVHPTLERRDFSRFLLKSGVLQSVEDSINMLLDSLIQPVEYISNSKYGDRIASSIRVEMYADIEEEVMSNVEFTTESNIYERVDDMREAFLNSHPEQSELIELMYNYLESLRG